jgi:predicted PurR-regulated permease PerM
MRGTALQNGFFLALLVLTTAAFIGLVFGFLMPVFWAAVLAVIFRPMYAAWLGRLHGRSSLAAVTTILIVLTLVILPLVLLGVMVSREATTLYQRFADGELNFEQQLESFRRAVPTVSAFLSEVGIDSEETQQGITRAGTAASEFLAGHALKMGQGAFEFTILLFLMLYFLFFFLRDGDGLITRILRALPLSYVREQQLLNKFAEVSRATIKGTCMVGAVQGALGGLAFWALGLPAPVLWGVLMAFMSILPVLGPAIIWAPAAGILLLNGQTAKGIILIVVGTLAIGLVDNILRPILVGRDTRMPDYLVLLATLGGLAVFGISGFVIGPLLAAFFITFWGMFEREFHGQPGLGVNAESEHPVLIEK